MPNHVKRVAVLLGSLLDTGLTGVASVVPSALISQDKMCKTLGLVRDADIQEMEKSITALQDSLSFMGKVVLQNRRGLDLFLLQGGLCSFLIDYSEVVQESVALG